MWTRYDNLTDKEVIRLVENNPDASELERALAERLDMRGRELNEPGYPSHDNNLPHSSAGTRSSLNLRLYPMGGRR